MISDNFIDFKFGDKWASEFNLVAVINGDRNTPPVFGSINANTSTLMGRTGVYKWNTQVNEKVFSINIAFEDLNVADMKRIKKWLNPHKIEKLIFHEEPFKYYWACLQDEISFSHIPFLTEVVNGIQQAVYKGEMTINFIALDNFAFSEWGGLNDGSDYEKDFILSLSNLLNNSPIYNNSRIYTKSHFEAESGNPDTSGIKYNRPLWLYNAGTNEANLNLAFDLIQIDPAQNLVIIIDKVLLTNSGETILASQAKIELKSFEDYIPFLKIFDEPRDNYQIVIDSDLHEVWIKHKTDETKQVNIHRFNEGQRFLTLADCDFVDYSKPFPTSRTEINGTAIEETIFNRISVEFGPIVYRLKNVDIKWKHTYM